MAWGRGSTFARAFPNIFGVHLHIQINKFTFALPFWKKVVGSKKQGFQKVKTHS